MILCMICTKRSKGPKVWDNLGRQEYSSELVATTRTSMTTRLAQYCLESHAACCKHLDQSFCWHYFPRHRNKDHPKIHCHPIGAVPGLHYYL